MGFVFAGSGDIPNGRFTLTPAQLANAGVQSALADAGLAGLGGNGWTFDDAGANQRLVNRPADDFNLTQFNYLQVPAERYMAQRVLAFRLHGQRHRLRRVALQQQQVDQQLTQSNINATSWSTSTTRISTTTCARCWSQLDAAETRTTTLPAQGSRIQTTTQNDGLAIINGGPTPGRAAVPAQR